MLGAPGRPGPHGGCSCEAGPELHGPQEERMGLKVGTPLPCLSRWEPSATGLQQSPLQGKAAS